ncbi:uncharacterized protein LOC124688737 [Lolium rigidum]|uniref:uncharacterized protein LOC124665477 n=1 Tax=Lolium rigidum TaxID=89674 RepID=UPI001F5E16F2|nr:uncharacterized protein LOC124665477 [Lolium rigidum]XP_047078333.1 uncharacterized protein LOC124688737 [Lolium rigidum]
MPISLSLFKPNQVAVQANPSNVGGREIEVDADGHSWWTNRLCHAWKDSQTPQLGFQRVVVLFVRDCRRGSTMFFKAARSQQNTENSYCYNLFKRIGKLCNCTNRIQGSPYLQEPGGCQAASTRRAVSTIHRLQLNWHPADFNGLQLHNHSWFLPFIYA